MSERKLASVAEVSAVSDIAGADRIQVARIRGWDVVVGKGQFVAGDTVVYFEIDSALPLSDERFTAFGERSMRTMPDGTDVHVLRTIKLRGQISQGLAMSFGELGLEALPVGTDVTDLLGITKWEPPVDGGSDAIGGFLSQYADKTDSERVQNLGEHWDELARHDWYATEKVDGTSLTVVCEPDGTIRVCSRNLEMGPASLYHRAARASGLFELLEPGLTVQGEIVGPGINGNRLRLDNTRVLLFALWRDRAVLAREQWPAWAIDMSVPMLDIEFPASADDAIAQVNAMRSTVNPEVQAEGVVWHTADGAQVPMLGRSTFKAINNGYLLKGD